MNQLIEVENKPKIKRTRLKSIVLTGSSNQSKLIGIRKTGLKVTIFTNLLALNPEVKRIKFSIN